MEVGARNTCYEPYKWVTGLLKWITGGYNPTYRGYNSIYNWLRMGVLLVLISTGIISTR